MELLLVPPDGRIRSRTLQAPTEHLTRRELRELEPYPEWADRPRRRGDCEHDARPCPLVSCRYHLYLEISQAGHIKLNHPGLEVWELGQTCALDVAESNGEGLALEDVGDLLNLTRERVRQLETVALEKLREHSHRNKDAA